MLEIPIIVRLENATISNGYDNVLSGVNLAIADGELAYIIGRSGAGKSSLIKTLYGENQLTSGQGQVADHNLNELDKNALPLFRRKIGIVFQEFHLLNHWTVQRNLEYVLKATDWKDNVAIKERVATVLDQVQMSDKAETIISNMSGGEQQKIAIARSILNSPSLLLADEPTGNLDPQSSEEIMNLLHQVARENKTAIVIATHNYDIIDKYPGRVLECIKQTLIEK